MVNNFKTNRHNLVKFFASKNWSPKLPKRGIKHFFISNIDRFQKRSGAFLPATIRFPLTIKQFCKWLNGLELSNNNAICILVEQFYYFSLEWRKVNSRKCEDKKSTKKCKKLKKKKKCKKKKVWKKCLKTCEKCDDSGTQINEHAQFTTQVFLPFESESESKWILKMFVLFKNSCLLSWVMSPSNIFMQIWFISAILD